MNEEVNQLIHVYLVVYVMSVHLYSLTYVFIKKKSSS